MDDKLKTEWIKRLRSGEYTQGQEVLRYSYGEQTTHCCLGVLSEILVEQRDDLTWAEPHIDEYEHTEEVGHLLQLKHGEGDPLEYDTSLPWSVVEELHLDSTADDGKGGNKQNRLIELNDTLGADFNQIADWIEENV